MLARTTKDTSRSKKTSQKSGSRKRRNEIDYIFGLEDAVKKGDTEAVRKLLNQCDGEEYNGIKELQEAITRRHVDIARLLLEHGAEVNLRKRSKDIPLILATNIKNREAATKLVELLLEFGADVNLIDSYGCTALHGAVHHNHSDIVKLLISRGADADIPSCYGLTPLHVAALEESILSMNILLKHGVDIEAKASEGATALSDAASNASCVVMKKLLDAGADIEVEEENGESPFHMVRCVISRKCFGDNKAYQVIGCGMMRNKALGLPVNEENLKIFKANMEGHVKPAFNFNKYEKALHQEVALMKKRKVSDSATLYDILMTKSIDYKSNTSITKKLKSIDYKDLPEFKDRIKSKIALDDRRYELTISARKHYEFLMHVSRLVNHTEKLELPRELIDKILSYMEFSDLHRLIRCGESLKSQLHLS